MVLKNETHAEVFLPRMINKFIRRLCLTSRGNPFSLYTVCKNIQVHYFLQMNMYLALSKIVFKC